MTNDLTIIYYTANRISPHFMANTQKQLLVAAAGTPIISVSHKRMNLGQNICVGRIGRSSYNIYWQILQGVRAAKAFGTIAPPAALRCSADRFALSKSSCSMTAQSRCGLTTMQPAGDGIGPGPLGVTIGGFGP